MTESHCPRCGSIYFHRVPDDCPAKPPLSPAAGSAACLDCGMPYDYFKLDTVFSREDWQKINPQASGLLCANCMVKRAAKLPRIITVRARLEWADEYDDPLAATAGSSADVEFMKQVIRAQARLLVAYRIGKTPPEWVFDTINKGKEVGLEC